EIMPECTGLYILSLLHPVTFGGNQHIFQRDFLHIEEENIPPLLSRVVYHGKPYIVYFGKRNVFFHADGLRFLIWSNPMSRYSNTSSGWSPVPLSRCRPSLTTISSSSGTTNTYCP